jgi:hypothetical protein
MLGKNWRVRNKRRIIKSGFIIWLLLTSVPAAADKRGVRSLSRHQDNLSLLRAAVHPTSLIGTWGQTHQSRALLFNLAAAPRLRRPLIISSARGPVALWPSWEADARAHASERRQNAQLSHVKYALGKCVNHVFKLSALFSAFSLRRSQALREMDTHSLNNWQALTFIFLSSIKVSHPS